MGTAVGGVFWAAVPKCGIGTRFRDRGGDALNVGFTTRIPELPPEIRQVCHRKVVDLG
jgi:hypothetical protein